MFNVTPTSRSVRSIRRSYAAAFSLPGLTLPLGISFFTFHSISYLIDVYRREVAPDRDPLEVAVYIAMFPQLIGRADHPLPHHRDRALGHRRTTLGRVASRYT